MILSAPAMAAMMPPGLRFGGWCVGSSVALMAAFVALNPKSLPLMCAAGAIALIQKELLA